MVNSFWAKASQGTANALIEVLSLHPHEVAVVEVLDDVLPHSLAHLFWVHCSKSGAIVTTSLPL